MPESTQHKLDRVRPPRVQITYDVETGGAIQKKELPLVVGIMADLAGKPAKPLPRLKQRKFVDIDRDNFEDVMAKLEPRLEASVPNRLAKEGNLKVELVFKHIDDFTPMNVVQQCEPLRRLFESRQLLNDLLAKLDGNESLDGALVEVVKNPEGMKQLKAASVTEEGK